MHRATSSEPTLFSAQRGRAIVRALQAGASQERAADVVGIGTRTLKQWIARGQTNPAGPFGAFARAVGEVYFARRPVACVRFTPPGAGRPQRQIVLRLDRDHLGMLPDRMRCAIEQGDVVPIEVVVRFAPPRG